MKEIYSEGFDTIKVSEYYDTSNLDWSKDMTVISDLSQNNNDFKKRSVCIMLSPSVDTYIPLNIDQVLCKCKYYFIKKKEPYYIDSWEEWDNKYDEIFTELEYINYKRGIRANDEFAVIYDHIHYIDKRVNGRKLVKVTSKCELIIDNKNKDIKLYIHDGLGDITVIENINEIIETLKDASNNHHKSFFKTYFSRDEKPSNYLSIENDLYGTFKDLYDESWNLKENKHINFYKEVIKFLKDKYGFEKSDVKLTSKGFSSLIADFALYLINPKFPNNHEKLLSKFGFSGRAISVNNGNYIKGILDENGVYSNLGVKLLNKEDVTKYNYENLFIISKIFGKDITNYLGNDDELYEKLFKGSLTDFKLKEFKNSTGNKIRIQISKHEKVNLANLFKDYINRGDYNKVENKRTGTYDINKLVGEIVDHFVMIERLQPFYPNERLEFTDVAYRSFVEEHERLSKMVSLLKKPFSKVYIYDDYTVNTIEEEFESENKEIYKPVILKMEDEYIEEGQYMHHCVASYANREDSMIISVRYYNEEKGRMDRVTCEYKNTDGRPIQKRFYNNNPYPKHFDEVLEELDKRIKKLTLEKKLRWIRHENVRNTINGIPV